MKNKNRKVNKTKNDLIPYITGPLKISPPLTKADYDITGKVSLSSINAIQPFRSQIAESAKIIASTRADLINLSSAINFGQISAYASQVNNWGQVVAGVIQPSPFPKATELSSNFVTLGKVLQEDYYRSIYQTIAKISVSFRRYYSRFKEITDSRQKLLYYCQHYTFLSFTSP